MTNSENETIVRNRNRRDGGVDAAAAAAAVVAVTFELAQKERLSVPVAPAFVYSSPQPSLLSSLLSSSSTLVRTPNQSLDCSWLCEVIVTRHPTPTLHRMHGNLKTEQLVDNIIA